MASRIWESSSGASRVTARHAACAASFQVSWCAYRVAVLSAGSRARARAADGAAGRAGKEPFPCLAMVQFADEAADDLIEYGACLAGAGLGWATCLGEVLHS